MTVSWPKVLAGPENIRTSPINRTRNLKKTKSSTQFLDGPRHIDVRIADIASATLPKMPPELWSIMVNVVCIIPVDNEVPLLGREDQAASKGKIDVESGSLSISWCVDDNIPNIIKVTPEIIDINLIIN